METRIINHNNYVIQTEEGTEKGIFFRSPIQSAYIDFYYNHDYNEKYTKNYFDKIKNPIRRIYEILIGNKDVVINKDNWLGNMDICGCIVKVMCSPIYFKRTYRKLSALSTDLNENIQSIESYGYESEFNYCAGDCVIEKTIIKIKDGRRIKFKRKEQYHFTYSHIIKRIIDDGLTKEDVK